MVSDLIGAQARTWDKLSSISRSKKIGSAYLFSGPVGSGKEGLALKFAQLINCKSGSGKFCDKCDSCLKFQTLQHEQLNLIIPLPTPKSSSNTDIIPKEYFEALNNKSKDLFYKMALPKANRILIQSIRDLKKKLYFKSEKESGRKFVLIFDAEQLCSGQGESGNALLKLLEEPPGETTFILVTDHKKMLFETIISRCQNIDIPCLNDAYIYDWLIEKQLSEVDADILVKISRGNIHNARMLSSQSIEDIMNTIEKLTTTVIGKDPQKWRNFTSHYSRVFNASQLDFDRQLNLIIIWLQGANKLRQNLVSGFERTGLHSRMISFNEKFPNANIYKIILCIEEVKSLARQNLYMPLILLNMLLDIQELIYE